MAARIRRLSLRDYCGYRSADLEFGDFACLYGPNGIGKSTVLNAISSVCSSLDYGDDARLRAQLRPNVRLNGEEGGASSFEVRALFERDGREYNVVLTEGGFETNELVEQDWWWPGLCYFSKFDSDMVNFQLAHAKWPKFKAAYEAITGFDVEPDVHKLSEFCAVPNPGADEDVVIGFWLRKPEGRVYSRRASAGEKKVAKSLTQVFNLEEQRQPDIVLVDNMEMHVYWKRHLRMFDVIKDLFAGKQIVATTHSTVVIEKYEPKAHLIDIEAVKGRAIMDATTDIKPDFDMDKIVEEFKRYFDGKKMDLVDYSYVNIQAYPPPKDPAYPEMGKFAAQWERLFEYADETYESEEGFPEELVARFEEATREIARRVNEDKAFWEKIRGEIIPLYDKSPYYDEWKKRWAKIEIFYYPEELAVKVTKRFRNKATGELSQGGEVITEKVMPPGFVINVL